MSRMRFAIEQALNSKSTPEATSDVQPSQDEQGAAPIVVSAEGFNESPFDSGFPDSIEENITEEQLAAVARANELAAEPFDDGVINSFEETLNAVDAAIPTTEDNPTEQNDTDIGVGFLQHIKDIDTVAFDDPPVEEIEEYISRDLDSTHADNINRFLGSDELDDSSDSESADEYEVDYLAESRDDATSQAQPVDAIDPLAQQVLTTEDRVADPVRAAHEVAGWYQPDDLSPPEQQAPATPFPPSYIDPEPQYDPDDEFKFQDYNAKEEFGGENAIGQTEFEASVIGSLSLPKVHSQYEQIWSGMRNGQMLKSPLVIGVVTTEPELHVAAALSHLAIMISYEMGRRVLLVDGDTRQQALTNAMELEGQRGFSETCLLECGWREAVVPTSHDKLCILPSGAQMISPAQIDSLLLPTMTTEWREMFDVIFVDIGDAQAAMACPLYKMCDKTFLLVRLGHTNREFADEIADQLADDGVNLAGCIVTNLP